MDGKKEDETPFAQQTDDSFYDSNEVVTSDYGTGGATSPIDEAERAAQEEEWNAELKRLEDEIITLRQVLSAKMRQSSELKRKLGITPIKELQKDFQSGLQNIKESDAYQRSSTVLRSAGTKTSHAFSSIGTYTKARLGDMKDSPAFKSFQEKMSGAVTNVTTRVRGSQSEQNFEEALSATTAEANGNATKSVPSTPSGEKASLS